MSVIEIVGQFKDETGLQPHGVLPLHTKFQRKGVGLGKFQSELPFHQNIGVIFQHFKGYIAVGAAQGDSHFHGDSVLSEKLHEPSHAHLTAFAPSFHERVSMVTFSATMNAE